MTTPKYREFWIEDRKEKDKPISRPYKKYVSSNIFGGLVGDEDYPDCEMIHVIEYDAYLDAATKCEAAQSELLSLRKENEKLNQALKVAEDVLKRYSKRTVWFKDGGQLRYESGAVTTFFKDEEWCESDHADEALVEIKKIKET